jgi:hypothetical protein
VTGVGPDGIKLVTDTGVARALSAAYCARDVEPAYALTAHGMQGGTARWAAVVASPQEMTGNWSYTALSRAREPTEIFVLKAPSEAEQDRAEHAPASVSAAARDPLGELTRVMRRRDDEDLAIDQLADERSTPARVVEGDAPAAQASITEAETRELQQQLAELKREIAVSTRRREAPDAVDAAFAGVVERHRAVREELAGRRKRQVEQALADPPEHLISALGPPPAERIARQRWDVRARQIEGLRFETGAPPDPAHTHETRGPTRRGEIGPPRRGPSLGR